MSLNKQPNTTEKTKKLTQKHISLVIKTGALYMMIIVVLSCYDCLFVSTDRSCCSYDSPLLIGRQNIFLWSSLSPCHRATIIAPHCFSMINATQCNSCNAWNSRNSANSFNFHFYWYHSVPPVALNCCTTILPSFIVIFYECRHG